MEKADQSDKKLTKQEIKDKIKKFEDTLAKTDEDLDRDLVSREDVMFDQAKFLKDVAKDHYEAQIVFREVLKKIGSPSKKLEVYLEIMQMTIHELNLVSVKADISECKKILLDGGDWEKKNKLKVFEGIYCMMSRDFSTAAELFLDSIATFTCGELIDYKTFVFYTVIMSVVS